MKMHRKKKKQLYIDIIDIQNEISIYHDICNGKDQTYVYYSDWRDHIANCYLTIKSERRLIDFKAFLRNRKRKASSLNGQISTYIMFAITLLFDHLFLNSHNDIIGKKAQKISDAILMVVFCIYIVWMILKMAKEAIFEGNTVCFYEDLLEILEEREVQLKEKEEEPCPSTQKPPTKMRS